MTATDKLNSFWATFNDTTIFTPLEFDDLTYGNIATNVLDTFGIPYDSSSANIGGALPNLDIKRMDAMQAIKLSLLEASAEDNEIYEPIVTPEGHVKFKAIGANTESLNDKYYEIQSSTYVEKCGGVMIIGETPLPIRKPIGWHLIWENGYHDIYRTGFMNNSCVEKNYNNSAVIIYTEPNLDSSYNDGIDNMYEITSENPYDVILGWATFIDYPNATSDYETRIEFKNTATILVPLEEPKLGTLFRRPDYLEEGFENKACYEDGLSADAPEATTGVAVPVPAEFRYSDIRGVVVDKLINIEGVYIVGREISVLRGRPKTPGEAILTNPSQYSADILVSITDTYDKVFKLTAGKDYVVAYSDAGGSFPEPYIIFADNSNRNDPIFIDGTQPTEFIVDIESPYCNDLNGELTDSGYILPLEGGGGVLVHGIYISMALDTPSIEIFNPDGTNDKAWEIANDIEYLVAPIVMENRPAPVAFNGETIDVTDSIIDHDPTTIQSLVDTDLELAFDAMGGNGLELRLSFLDESQCRKLSEALYNYMNSQDGVESTYVCGPNTYPELGDVAPNGGIINSISYSYQDSSAYTVSVNSGPTLVGGFAQVAGEPSMKLAENVSAAGTIIADIGNNIHYKVRIDGYGDKVALNMCNKIIRVGDKVQCQIHNNPVEA